MTAPNASYSPPTLLIGLSTGASVLGITLITPALPFISDDFDVSANVAQFLFTGYLLMLALSQLVVGPLSDLFGRRPFILLGAIMIACGGLLGMLAKDITALIIARILQGLGAGACISMARAMINDAFTRQEAARKMASVQSIQAVIPIVGLMSGGALIAQFGWISVMWLMFFAGIILTLLLLTSLKETFFDIKPKLHLASIARGYAHVFKVRVFLAFAFVSSTQVGMFFAMNSFLPYRYTALGVSSLEFGFWFGLTPASYLLGNLVNRFYLIKFGIERAIMIGCSLCAVSLTALFVTQSLDMTHVLALALPCCLFGFSNGLTVANSVIGGIKSVGANAGTASGVIGACQMLVGSLLGGAIIFLGGDENITLATAVLLGAGLLSMLVACPIYLSRQTKPETAL